MTIEDEFLNPSELFAKYGSDYEFQSNSRILPRHKFPKHPKGRCRWCGGEVKKPRRTFCSDVCVDDWMVRRSPGLLRKRVEKRDRGVCAGCGLDTDLLMSEINAAIRPLQAKVYARIETPANREKAFADTNQATKAFLKRHVWLAERLPNLLGQSRWATDRSLWEADHIVAISEGGDPFDLNNLRTLCVPCHKSETAKLRARLAVQSKRRKSDENSRNNRQLSFDQQERADGTA